MISDDERREVARRLREIRPCKSGHIEWWKIAKAFDLKEPAGWFGWEKFERDSANRLADLIEPESERTCRMVSAFDTDELENIQENISFSPEDTLAYRCEGCGFDFRYERGLYPSYCPNCGARVMNDARD